MKLTSTLAILLVLSPVVRAQSRPARHTNPEREPAAVANSAQSLPIRRVILYSNGVGYFERRGTVTGHAEINLTFKKSQIDDVLKSMVVLDLGRGRIEAVSYNSSAPLPTRLSEVPFSIAPGSDDTTAGGLSAVLRQLQGARVTVATANRAVTGTILTVEDQRSQIDANKPPVTRHSLVIDSEAGELQSFDLADLRSVRVLDEEARHDISEFSTLSASARRRESKTVIVTSDGAGAREMMVSYTIAAPIWKTTYRVVLDASGKPFFQGWAIVDNVSEEDWRDVSLSLVSGTPVSFLQPVQEPLYRYRPVIPIPQDLQLNPQVYEPAAGAAGGLISGVAGVGFGVGGGVGSTPIAGLSIGGPTPLNGPVPATRDMPGRIIASAESGVQAAATGAEVGELFEYRLDRPITVRRGSSALVPILQTRMEGDRVSIYRESARKDRPMSGLRLKNTSALTLEGGSLTVIDDNAYAGEALMERLKAGEDRFISFAVDLGTLVTTRSEGGSEPAFLVRFGDGVFETYYYETAREVYTFTNQTDRPRVIFVEHPARSGWQLAKDTPKPDERTAGVYRFRVDVAARQTVELPVAERRTLVNSYQISALTPKILELLVSSRNLEEATRDVIKKIIEIKSRIASVDSRLSTLDQEAEEIGKDQERLRANIQAFQKTPEARQLIARYITKAGEEESRIEDITGKRRAATDERSRFQAELEAALRALGPKS